MRIAVFLVLVILPGVAFARGASHFGFGPPPSYPDLVRQIEAERFSPFVAEWKSAYVRRFEISRPVATCRNRNFLRAALCGYRFCIRQNGKSLDLWLAVGLGIKSMDEPCEFTAPWTGDPPVDVADFCKFQPKHDQCVAGVKETYPRLSIDESTGAAEIARQQKLANARIAEEKARAKAEVEKILSAAKKQAEEEEAELARLRSSGSMRAYPSLASYRYRKCQDLANLFLQAELKKFPQFDQQLETIKQCAMEEEAALTVDARDALQRAPLGVKNQIKELHAYTVASLRSLSNFHQSEIQAREARAERMAGIDERATRLELEFQ